jgi:hypothetical protein
VQNARQLTVVIDLGPHWSTETSLSPTNELVNSYKFVLTSMEHILTWEDDSGLGSQEFLALCKIRRCSQEPNTWRYPE